MIKRVLYSFIFMVTGFLLAASVSWATYMAEITYDYTGGPGSYVFDFTIKNTSDGGSTGPLDYFSIDFDAGDASQYTLIPGDSDFDALGTYAWVANNGWFSEASEYDPGFGGTPANVLADDSVFGGGGGGIAQGASLGGFKVKFDYAGPLAPENMSFSWIAEFGTSDVDNGGIDMGGYWILGDDAGQTVYEQQGPPQPPVIPEPGTIILLGFGLLGVAGLGRRN